MVTPPQVDHELDCRGLACPLPIIKTKKAVDALTPGQVLKMVASDPGSVRDMAAWVAKTGHEMLAQMAEGVDYSFYIRKVR